MSKQEMISEVLSKLTQLGISCSQGQGTDVSVKCEFLDSGWNSGNKKINYDSSIFFDESSQTIFMWEMTKEVSSGFSFGNTSESSFQLGKTLFRKVKSVQYGLDGKAYEYSLDLGAISKAFKETAKAYGWKFKTVLNKEKALYPEGSPRPANQTQPLQTKVVQQAYEQITPQAAPLQFSSPPPVPIQTQSFTGAIPPPPPTVFSSGQVSSAPPPSPLNDGQKVSNSSNQQYSNPQGVFYSQGKPNKAESKVGILYWILFFILALFDVLLAIGGSGILFFAISIVFLVGLFVLRKGISKSWLKTILCFIAALIATLIVFSITGTEHGNSAKISIGKGETNKLAEASISIGSKDKPDISPEGFARSVEEGTLKPVGKTKTFKPDENFIYYSILVNYLPEKTEIKANWYFNGKLVLESQPELMGKALVNQYYTTHLQRGQNLFPQGNYKIELIISKESKEIFKSSDDFVVSADSSANPSSSSDKNMLFTDLFERPDSSMVGDGWIEVAMRNGTGNSVPSKKPEDTPWSIKNKTLSYEAMGNGTYTEDFIQTVNEFPIDNTKVEFEIRGTASTKLGYVGPGAFWAPSPDKRVGGFETIDGKQPLIGVQAFYGWESSGTKGLVYKLGGGMQKTDSIFAGINQNEFIKHTIIIKNGTLTYQASNNPSVTYELNVKPLPGEKRHFSFDVRYYDNGIPFKTEIKNFKISLLD